MKRTRTMHRATAALTAVLLLGMMVPALPAAALEPPLDVAPQQVFAVPAGAYNVFGGSTAVWGDTAIVGTVGENSGKGAAYIFTRHGGVWFFRQRLVADDYTGQDGFGGSVAISGKTVLVGALGYNENRGAVFVFTESGGIWTKQTKLTASDPAVNDAFGASVALDDGTALIGATGDDEKAGEAGAAYIFTGSGSTWTERKKLTATDSNGEYTGDGFGCSVALGVENADGDYALIGASGDNSDRGAAYIFIGGGSSWPQRGKVGAWGTYGAAGDRVGASVAMGGNAVLLGAPGDDEKGDGAGAAYIWTGWGSAWIPQAKLTGSAAAAGDWYGSSVALSGGAALIGAPRHGGNRGAAYLFTGRENAWTERHRFAAADGQPFDELGGSVAISGGTALVGVEYDDTPAGQEAGSAWFCSFTYPLTPGVTRIAGANRYATAVAASKRGFPAGAPAVVVATGTNWPDALGGSALAGAAHGPLLLTKKDGLPAEVATEIRRLGAVKAYVLGSTAAVGSGVENALVSMLGRANVVRLGGANRYETANKVAQEAVRLRGPTYSGAVYVTTGRNYPDATAASPMAAALSAPVLLVNPASPSVALPTGASIAFILGSTASVSAAVEADLVSRLGRFEVQRVGGANRYATAARLADVALIVFGRDTIGLATGENFPDALTAGPMLVHNRTAALVLTRPGVLPGETKALLQAGSSQLKSMFIFGDYNAVSAAVEAAARTAAGL